MILLYRLLKVGFSNRFFKKMIRRCFLASIFWWDSGAILSYGMDELLDKVKVPSSSPPGLTMSSLQVISPEIVLSFFI